MLLALLSDTHDNVASTRRALELLAPHAPAAYLHAGDLVAATMLEHFRGLPFHFVFGNNEWDHAGVKSTAKALDIVCHDFCAELTFENKHIGLLHGHDLRLLRTMIDGGRFDYLVHGHTHVHRDEKIGPTRVINPGALQRARVKTVALLDTAADTVQFIVV